MNAAMIKGVVVFYFADKGYGYIRVPDTREEFHFKRQHLTEPVKAGDSVFFNITQNKQGFFAKNIRLATIS